MDSSWRVYVPTESLSITYLRRTFKLPLVHSSILVCLKLSIETMSLWRQCSKVKDP